MGLIKFTNFGTSTVANAGGISAADLSVDVQAGDGALFPTLTGSSYFYIVCIKTTGAREIMKVTARAVDTLTIVRAQDGTSALAFAAADKVELRATAAALEMITDLNGEELILDADGDTSITADTDDQIDIKISGTDQFSFKDGVIEPTTNNDIDLGASAKQFKDLFIDGVGYVDEFDIDGTWKAAFPTNGVGADAKIMLGDSNTIVWFYLNTAPPGWKVTALGADMTLAVSGGANAFNANGGTDAGTWAQPNHTHTGPSHTHTGPSHTHTMNTHTHTGPSHTHTGPNHTHTMNTHTHTMGTHLHLWYSFITSGVPGQSYDNVGVLKDFAWAHNQADQLVVGVGGGADPRNPASDYYTSSIDPGDTNATDPGDTNAGGTGATGAGGTGNTGAKDPGNTNAGGTAATGSGGTGATAGGATANTWRPSSAIGKLFQLDTP